MRGDYCASTRRTLVGQVPEHCVHQWRYFQAHTGAHHECERYEPRTNVRSGRLLLASTRPKTRSPNHRLRKAQSPTAVAASATSLRATDRTHHRLHFPLFLILSFDSRSAGISSARIHLSKLQLHASRTNDSPVGFAANLVSRV